MVYALLVLVVVAFILVLGFLNLRKQHQGLKERHEYIRQCQRRDEEMLNFYAKGIAVLEDTHGISMHNEIMHYGRKAPDEGYSEQPHFFKNSITKVLR